MRKRYLWAGGLALVGVLAIGWAFLRPSSPGSYLSGKYQQVSSENSGHSRVYRASVAPDRVFNDIRSHVKPADTFTDPGGYFLRYRDNIVAVTAEGTGSRIYLDDDRRGYARWYPFIGGYWGSYGGTGEVFRGGGPGSGK
jgi:hypothetical protein